jgi:hypothetical protein
MCRPLVSLLMLLVAVALAPIARMRGGRSAHFVFACTGV